MSSRTLPVAVAGLGLFLAAGTVLAVVERAFVPAAVFGAVAVLHLAIAAGLARGSRAAAVGGGLLGLVEVLLVAVGLWFIVGIQTGIGVDFGDQWFAPLNGFGTIAVTAVIVTVAVGMVRRAVLAVRATTAVAAAG